MYAHRMCKIREQRIMCMIFTPYSANNKNNTIINFITIPSKYCRALLKLIDRSTYRSINFNKKKIVN